MKIKFQEFELNDRVKKIFDKLNARTLNTRLEAFDYEDECFEEGEEDKMSTQLLRTQKNQLIDLKQHLERYINSLPVIDFNSYIYDFNLLNSYLIPYLYVIKNIKSIKKANDFCYYHFCSSQETRPSLSEQDIEKGIKNLEMDELRRE